MLSRRLVPACLLASLALLALPGGGADAAGSAPGAAGAGLGTLVLTNYTPLYQDCVAPAAFAFALDLASGLGTLALTAAGKPHPTLGSCNAWSDAWGQGQCRPREGGGARCAYAFAYANGSGVTSTLDAPPDGSVTYRYLYRNANPAMPSYDLVLTGTLAR